MSKSAFCIYVSTFCEGPVPAVRDGYGNPCVFKTELEAQCEIADNMITRLQEFIDGEREFEDAMTVEEYVVPVMFMRTAQLLTWTETILELKTVEQ